MSDDREFQLEHDGRERRFLVHLPAESAVTKPSPMVLGFHGGGARAAGFQVQSRLNDAADRFGFMAVYPEGTGLGPLQTFNAGRCCGYAVRKQVDDVGFVRRMLDELEHTYNVDRNRIYATGISNGAMLCYRLACEMSDQIAAIGPVAGTLSVDGPVPKRPVPIIHFHGTEDPNCMFQGGLGPNSFLKVAHRSVPDTIAWWVKVNRCRQDVVRVADGSYIRESYSPAPGEAGAPVVLYVLPGGGHTWPGGVDVSAALGTGRLIETVDATTIMWRFFEQHRLAYERG